MLDDLIFVTWRQFVYYFLSSDNESLRDNGGTLAVGDKSDPETIYTLFGVSKKVFKQAIGALYKQKQIEIEKMAIRLI